MEKSKEPEAKKDFLPQANFINMIAKAFSLKLIL
jgi:hypothetical protein